MALLRNREVQILRVATEVDGSTFVVRYPDAETEMAKMNELIFTPAEYDAFVRTQLPDVQVMDQAKIDERKELSKPDPKDEPKTAEVKRPEDIKPNLKPMTALSNADMNKSVDQSKPSTYPDNKHAPKKA